MLTSEDFKELKPQFEEIHRHLNVALIKSGVEIPHEACVHFFAALLLSERLVQQIEQVMWHRLSNAEGVSSVSEVSILTEMVIILGVGSEVDMAEDFQEFMPDFVGIHRHLNVAILKSWSADVSDDAKVDFVNALLLMKNLTCNTEHRVWNGIKESVSLIFEEDSDESSWLGSAWERAKGFANPSAEKAGAAGFASGAAAAASFTGMSGFGIAAGGTAVGLAGLTGGIVATGGTGLAGAAALYLLYKGGEAVLKTDRSFLGKRLPWRRKGENDES